MQVLHITNRLSEGGVDTLLYQLLIQLQTKSIDVDILVLDPQAISLVDQFRTKGIRVFISRYKSLYNPLNILQLRDYMKRYDILHSHLFPTQYYVAFARKIFSSKALFVTTEHCTTNKRRKLKWMKPIERFVYRQYDSIIGVSKTTTDNLSRWIRNDQVKTILNGIDLEHIYKADLFNFNKLVSSEVKTIVMVARFFDQKDQKTAIQALRHLPDYIHLVFVGSGETMDECIHVATYLGVHNRTHFLGYRKDVATIIKGGTICLLSTYYEGLSIAVIEYLAAGKAVIGTNVDGMKELISDEKLLFNIGDDEMLAQVAMYLLNNQVYRKKIERDNYIKSKEFNLTDMADKYFMEYRRIYSIKNI
jgi:glycosyltransferase involved in cell wall biosynthesis